MMGESLRLIMKMSFSRRVVNNLVMDMAERLMAGRIAWAGVEAWQAGAD
jgi:hypothetical protein